MPDFMPSLPQLLLLAALGTLIVSLWRRSHKHFGRDREAQSTSPKRTSSLDKQRELALADAPPELTRWQVEMYETARDLKAEIDTKLGLLQVLTRHAEAAAQRLEAAAARAERIAAGRLDPLAAIEAWSEQTNIAPSHSTHPAADRIYALADEGRDAAAIFQQTGIPLGEIEMLLSLRT